MRIRAAILLSAVVLASACDKKDAPAAPGRSSLSAPAPARFGHDAPPALARYSSRADAARLASGPAAPPETAANAWNKYFDGSTSAAPLAVPSGPRRVVRAGMAIDTDGARRAPEDPYWQGDTSLHYANGRPLDAQTVPFVVIPLGENRVGLGDLVKVSYRGRSVMAVVGDRGPRYGEASAATARALGIPASGLSGGVDSGVTYEFFPGSARRPKDQSQLMADLRGRSTVTMASLK